MRQAVLIFTGISGALAVAMGAFGAHALKNVLSDYQSGIWHTAVQYQFYHTLVLLAVGLSDRLSHFRGFKYVASLFIAGILLFSGSLYILASTDLLGLVKVGFIGAFTPIGGLCFILAWLGFAWSVIRTPF